MKIKLTITSEVFVDLEETPYSAWPEEAKTVARNLVSSPRIRRELMEQLPALRHSWLAVRVARASEGITLDALD